jgi:Pvc16 N-terminal domain
MSSYHVLSEVSGAIKRILWDEFSAEPDVLDAVPSEASIVFTNPKRTAQNEAGRLSLWLYSVSENEYVKNQPIVRGEASDTTKFPPLALDLSYLVTPMARGPDPEKANHLLLGKTMEALYDNSTTLLSTDDKVAEELHIALCRLSILELAELWEALQEDYRLSVCYQVRVIRIDSTRIPADARVVERDTTYGPRPQGATGR